MFLVNSTNLLTITSTNWFQTIFWRGAKIGKIKIINKLFANINNINNLPIVWLWFFVLIIPPEPSCCCFESLVFSVSRNTAWSKQSEAARENSSWTCFPFKWRNEWRNVNRETKPFLSVQLKLLYIWEILK